MNVFPEFHLKYRVFEETESRPAFLVGIDTQGFGPYLEYAKQSVSGDPGENSNEEISRYEQKAWGIYIVASKNWDLLGNLGLHIGLNKNTWESDPYETNDKENIFKEYICNVTIEWE